MWLWAALLARRTARGWEVADLVDQGLTYDERPPRLGITQSAVSQRAAAAGIVEGRRARELVQFLTRDRPGRRPMTARDTELVLTLLACVHRRDRAGHRPGPAPVDRRDASRSSGSPSASPGSPTTSTSSRDQLITVVAGVVAVAGGGLVTTQVFGIVDRASPVRRAGEVLRGGAWIGALERLAVYVALVAGWGPGLAIVLAVKGLGRYPELRSQEDTGAAERFIIGTFTSVLWAVACVGLAVLPA